MKRILIIANTYYQLIFAIQMKYSIFKNEEVVLLMSNHSKNADQVVEKLKGLKIFNQVTFIKTKEIRDKKKTLKDKCNVLLEATLKSSSRYDFYLKDIGNLKFDEMIFYNWGIDMYCVYSKLAQYNSDIRISIMEEGIFSYDVKISERQRKLIRLIRHLSNKKHILDVVDSFYCFYPALYSGKLNAVAVPNISKDEEMIKVLKCIFSLSEECLEYNYKYIFFTSVYDFEGGASIKEYELVCKIADLIGKDNLLVKTHPRDTRTIYEDAGLKVDKNSSIPWEAIQLSADFSDKVFLTATSGSVLAGSLMSDKPVKTFYMYRMCKTDDNQLAIKTASDIEKLLSEPLLKERLKTVKIAETLEDIL